MLEESKIISTRDFKLLALLMASVAILMTFSTLTVQKIVFIADGFTIPGASIWFSLITFPAMQILCSFYGKKFANFAIFIGWIAMLMATIMAQITVLFPYAPSFAAHAETFNFLMTNSVRYFIAATFSFVSTHIFGNLM
jgi:uncharacterized PurR-regulated membrane protein YhhQ (DUF165 family)